MARSSSVLREYDLRVNLITGSVGTVASCTTPVGGYVFPRPCGRLLQPLMSASFTGYKLSDNRGKCLSCGKSTYKS